MPKRAYPFEETFSLQYKIHIGPKEMNQGVLGNKYRHKIYEKTKNLMFTGVKAVMGKICREDGTGVGTEASSACPQPALGSSLLKGQTLIGQDGKLRKGAIPSTAGACGVPVSCCVCLIAASVKEPCSQCDRLPCPSCSRQCISCASLCCSVCTIVDYSDRYDRVLCFDCSP
ncbi:apoptosis regulatory protein Siva [Amia ocellicauda]|uniref:apoptosis regulatory protein Siva n=1 Tax=Amia ocellicauda TaxID=2972642 RepID=UPI003463B31D